MRIFICYRRDDSIATAGHIWSWLKVRLPPDSLFFDKVTIPPGSNFKDSIRHAVLGESRVVLVIIGQSWLLQKGADGQLHNRLFDADDQVRQEIELALTDDSQGRLVIPVLVENATMPSKSDLPQSILAFADLNAVSVRPAPDFENDMRALRSALQKQVPDLPFAPAYTYENISGRSGLEMALINGVSGLVERVKKALGKE